MGWPGTPASRATARSCETSRATDRGCAPSARRALANCPSRWADSASSAARSPDGSCQFHVHGNRSCPADVLGVPLSARLRATAILLAPQLFPDAVLARLHVVVVQPLPAPPTAGERHDMPRQEV